MERGISIVVSRSDDRVVLMVPAREDDDRNHAVVVEDEAFVASSTIRRMLQSRERRSVEIGEIGCGMRIDRVDHPRMPIEIHLDDDEGVTILDLTKDDALCIADMLWGAHRSTGAFHASTTISGGRRRRDGHSQNASALPRPDDLTTGDARLLGMLNRRVRGEGPETKI